MDVLPSCIEIASAIARCRQSQTRKHEGATILCRDSLSDRSLPATRYCSRENRLQRIEGRIPRAALLPCPVESHGGG
jgi:hypothetical protein